MLIINYVELARKRVHYELIKYSKKGIRIIRFKLNIISLEESYFLLDWFFYFNKN